MNDGMVYYGGNVKALGDGKVGGYLVKFGSPDQLDLSGEYFTADTDFGPAEQSEVYYQHGMDSVLKQRVLGIGKIRKDDVGVWIEAQLNLRDAYEEAVYGLVKQGKMGWSSGTAGHLIAREKQGGATYIKRWKLGIDASITPTPAEPRTSAVPLKSLISSTGDDNHVEPEAVPEARQGGTSGDADESNPAADSITQQLQPKLEVVMNDVEQNAENTPAPENPFAEQMKAMDARLSALMDIMTETMETEPRINRSGFISVDGETADRSIKNAADMVLAIKRGDRKRLTEHYGLKSQNEGSGPSGGYLVPETVLGEIMPTLNLNSGFAQLVTRIPTQTPTGNWYARDFTNNLTAGSGNTNEAGGITSRVRAEGGAYTKSTMSFERNTYSVSDAASDYLSVTRELLNDAPQLAAMIQNSIRIDVASKEEYYILFGTGVGQPLGVLNWAGLVTVDEETDNTFVVADSDNMLDRFLSVSADRSAWVHHHSLRSSIAAFERGTGGAVYQPDISGALPQALHGYMRFNSQHLPQIGTDGYTIIGDWSQYLMMEHGGLYIEYSEHADFLNGNHVWRFGKRIDGKPVMSTAVPLNGPGTAFTLSPFVAIGNRA